MSAPDVGRLLAALRALPTYEGTVFRGAPRGVPAEVVVGAPLPTSADVRVATENFSSPVIVAVLTTQGRHLGAASRRADEGEVILLPGTVLRLAARTDDDRLVVYEEAEAPGDARIDQVLAELTVTLEQARGAEPVAVTSPGKYAGPLPGQPSAANA